MKSDLVNSIEKCYAKGRGNIETFQVHPPCILVISSPNELIFGTNPPCRCFWRMAWFFLLFVIVCYCFCFCYCYCYYHHFSCLNIGIWHIKSNVSVCLLQCDRLADAVAVVLLLLSCCCFCYMMIFITKHINQRVFC